MTNEELKVKVIEIIRDHFNWDDETNTWHSTIYVDYNDYEAFEEYTIKDILKSEHPRETFYEKMWEAYDESEWYEVKYVVDDVEKTLIQEDIDFSDFDLTEFVRDHANIKLPYDDFLGLKIPVNIVIDAGDANYDFGCNDSWSYANVDGVSGIAYLAKKQGYTLTQLRKAINSEKTDSVFLKSAVDEWRNASGGCNATTLFATITVEQLFDFYDIKNTEKSINNRYYPWKGKGKSYIIVSADTPWGLVDYWHGGGSLLEGKLERDMKIPLKYIFDIMPEAYNSRGYTVHEIYGCGTSWYTGEMIIKKINNKLLKKED